MSNTGLTDIIVDVDSKEITMSKGNFVAYNKKNITTEAEIISSTEAPTVSNSDSVQSRSVIFMASLDVD
jgi:hypothetical protein